MKRQNFTHTLPATRCTEEMRTRTTTLAEALSCDTADLIRDALSTLLVHGELAAGLTTLDDYEDEELEAVGLGRAVEERRMAAQTPAPTREDRTRGLAWGTPVEPTPPVPDVLPRDPN